MYNTAFRNILFYKFPQGDSNGFNHFETKEDEDSKEDITAHHTKKEVGFMHESILKKFSKIFFKSRYK